MKTITKIDIPDELFANYLSNLINQFFKILPIKENKEPSLNKYIRSLERELLGCGSLISAIKNDSMFLSLVSILQYLIDNDDCDTHIVKQEVFKAIDICKKLHEKYFVLEVPE